MRNKKVFSAVKKCVMFFAIFGTLFTLQMPNLGRAMEADKPTDAEWLVNSGENHVWYKITEDILTIGGTGEMPDWDSGEDTPWYDDRSTITRVVVSDGITRIGNNAFRGEEANKYSSNIEEFILSANLSSIGDYAFRYNGNIAIVAIKNPTPPTFGDGIFWDTSEGMVFAIPASARAAYFDSDWKVNDDTGEGYLFDFNAFSAYFVYITNSDGGKVSSTLEYLIADFYIPATVELTLLPDSEYSLASLTVTGEDGADVPVENNSFVMPEKSVTVNAVFTSDVPKVPNTGVR